MAVETRVPRPSRSRLRRPGLALALVTLCACARTAGTATAPAAAKWLNGDLLGASSEEAQRLRTLAAGSSDERLRRLDRLLDLHDAARFSGDEAPRETLWESIGGHPTGQGDDATRDAWLRLLEEALAIEDLGPRSDSQERFLADAIQLLSVDLELPTTADDLAIRTLAYRNLALRGHIRVADNARWRLYDHVYRTLEGAIEAPADRRLDVAVHALYAARDDIHDFIADVAPHVRPPWPSASQLWATLRDVSGGLAEEPRWETVVDARRAAEEELLDTLEAVLPAQRSDTWPVPAVPAGTGRPESLSPVVLASDGAVAIDAGRPGTRSVAVGDAAADELTNRCRTALARDGRGGLLFVAPPMLPSPQLRAVLDALVRCKVARLELALREPRVPANAGQVIVALPVEVALNEDLGPGAQAIREARVHVHLDGRGPRVSVDGKWISERPTPKELPRLLERIDRAYPREQVVALTIGDDVLYQQFLELVVALCGGPLRHYQAVGWRADADPPEERPHPAHDRLVRVRASLYVDEPAAELDQSFPLREGDQRRLEELAKALSRCLPELEVELREPRRVTLTLAFVEGRLTSVKPARLRGVRAKRLDAVRTCVEDEATGFRLREHRDRVELTVKLGGGRR